MYRRFIALTSFLLFLLFSQSVWADSLEDMRLKVVELNQHHHDIQKLEEAALMSYDVAMQSKALEDQIYSMQFMNDYASFLTKNMEGAKSDVKKKMKAKLYEQFARIISLGDAALKTAPNNASAVILRALGVAQKGSFDGITASIKIIDPTFEALHKARKLDPKALDGLGQLVLGRMYFEVPGLLGGDSELAVQYLEEAHQISPIGVTGIRFLAEAYEDEGEDEKAEATLTKLLTLSPKYEDLQETVDQFKSSAGLAKRWGYKDLSEKIKAKRENLLKKHPFLLSRNED